jgi:hypothetical protein
LQQDHNEIRPSLWVLALLTVTALGVLTWWLLTPPGGNDERGEEMAERSERNGWFGGGSSSNGNGSRRRSLANGSPLGPNLPWTPIRLSGWGVEEGPEDPQLLAMRRTLNMLPDAGGPPPPFMPVSTRARLTRVSGTLPLAPGASCEVRVLPVATETYNCLVRVMCEGVVIYPDNAQTAGYAPCDVRDGIPFAATDDGVTHADGDPTVSVNAETGQVTVSDDGPGVNRFAAELEFERI